MDQMPIMSHQGINIPFAFGELLLGLEAFFIRDWVQLQLVAHAPVLALISLACLCPESVRWLLAKEGLTRNLLSSAESGDLSFTVKMNKFLHLLLSKL